MTLHQHQNYQSVHPAYIFLSFDISKAWQDRADCSRVTNALSDTRQNYALIKDSAVDYRRNR